MRNRIEKNGFKYEPEIHCSILMLDYNVLGALLIVQIKNPMAHSLYFGQGSQIHS